MKRWLDEINHERPNPEFSPLTKKMLIAILGVAALATASLAGDANIYSPGQHRCNVHGIGYDYNGPCTVTNDGEDQTIWLGTPTHPKWKNKYLGRPWVSFYDMEMNPPVGVPQTEANGAPDGAMHGIGLGTLHLHANDCWENAQVSICVSR